MANKRRVRAKNYSSDTILFRNILGILLMAIGVLAGLSVAEDLLEGSVFLAIRHIVQGLGGTLCLGVPIFIVWGGAARAAVGVPENLSARVRASVAVFPVRSGHHQPRHQNPQRKR